MIATVLVLGAITGLYAVRQAILSEVLDMASHFHMGIQSYSFSGQDNCETSTAGSGFSDVGCSILLRSTAATMVLDPNKASE